MSINPYNIGQFLRFYLQKRMVILLMLGFASGLPLALTASTLGVWLTEAGVSKTSIGLFAAVSIPYTLKFLWSPLMDGLQLPVLTPLLGRRRAWLLTTQIALMICLLLMAACNPSSQAGLIAFFALLTAIASASQDIVIDAYRVESLPPEEQGGGAAMLVLGYRFGMIASAAGALYMAAGFGWPASYALMAGLMGVGIAATLMGGEPEAATGREGRSVAAFLRESVIAPFADFLTRRHWAALLAFILLYKLADAFMGVMTNPFLIDIGFSKEQIASIVKLYGVIATIIGSIAGGSLVQRWGVGRSLLICGIAHAITNAMFILLAHIGPDSRFLALSITLENISGGMGTAAFVAFLGNLCNRRFTATQYALLSSFSAFGRTWLATPSGWFAEQLGWPAFFTLATLLAIPGLLLLAWLRRREIV